MENNEIRIVLDAPKTDVSVNRKILGRVVNFKPYGFFVETDDGRFGLVHVKNIKGWNGMGRFDEVFPFGSKIEVSVLDVESTTNRLSFACEMPPTSLGQYMSRVPSTLPPTDAPSSSVEQVPAANHREEAELWANENPESSQRAYDWLKRELAEGPLFGPLTTALCEKFGVPVPASRWIRLFPDFACYSGNGDNPSGLPAVALVTRADDAGYWKNIKKMSDQLIENRNRKDDGSLELAALAMRLNDMEVFPGAQWIADFEETARGLRQGRDVYGVRDVVERLALPLLGQLGWSVSPTNAALVRGDESTFHIRVFSGPAVDGKVALAVLCASARTTFDSLRGERNVIRRVMELYNRLGDGSETKVAWTNGTEWVVFSRQLLAECIGVLAEDRGETLMDELVAGGASERFVRVQLPDDAKPFVWLSGFADLYASVSPFDCEI